jgi:hypothetical protein
MSGTFLGEHIKPVVHNTIGSSLAGLLVAGGLAVILWIRGLSLQRALVFGVCLVIGLALAGVLASLARYLWPRRRDDHAQPVIRADFDCIGELNRFFKLDRIVQGKFYIYGVLRDEPKLNGMGERPLTPIQEQRAQAMRAELENALRVSEETSWLKYRNDCHALLKGKPEWSYPSGVLNYETLDFAGVCALRGDQVRPEIISACVLLFCDQRKTVYLHERPSDAATYPSQLHTFGGAFMPRPRRGSLDYDGSLLRTARRKLREEVLGDFEELAAGPVPLLLGKEEDSGFIQLVLPVNLSSSDVGKMLERSPLEGKIESVKFRDLADFIRKPPRPWVPTGKAHLLGWLALGAPGCGTEQARFGKHASSATELFDELSRDLTL